MTGFLKVLAGIAKGAEIRVQGSSKRVTPRSYGQKELHHVFALEAHVLGTFHHVFALDLCFGGYLEHVSDASGSWCLVTVSYLDIWCFML